MYGILKNIFQDISSHYLHISEFHVKIKAKSAQISDTFRSLSNLFSYIVSKFTFLLEANQLKIVVRH